MWIGLTLVESLWMWQGLTTDTVPTSDDIWNQVNLIH